MPQLQKAKQIAFNAQEVQKVLTLPQRSRKIKKRKRKKEHAHYKYSQLKKYVCNVSAYSLSEITPNKAGEKMEVKNEMIPTANAELKTLDLNLFYDFVRWIDRSEATTRTYLINFKQFIAWLKYKSISTPTRNDIISYREWLKSEHEAIQLDAMSPNGWKYRTDKNGDPVIIFCKPSTIKLYLQSVCAFFKWASANGYYPNIATNIHAPKIDNTSHKKDYLTPEQVFEIESSIEQKALETQEAAAQHTKDKAGRITRSNEQGKRLHAMYLLAVNAGLRTVEISRANIRDLHLKNGHAVLYVWGKGRSEPDQKKPLADEVYSVIKDYLQARSDHYTGNSPLFVSTGNRSKGKRIAPTTISTMLKNAMKSAGFDSERLTAHSLRHSTGTAVQSITKDLIETQKYMRHSNPATTEIYIHDGEEQELKSVMLAQQLYRLFHNSEQTSRSNS